jgi:hypothetical protein
MKTRLDASYLGLVCSVFSCWEEKIEMKSGTRTGEILQLPTKNRSTSFIYSGRFQRSRRVLFTLSGFC